MVPDMAIPHSFITTAFDVASRHGDLAYVLESFNLDPSCGDLPDQAIRLTVDAIENAEQSGQPEQAEQLERLLCHHGIKVVRDTGSCRSYGWQRVTSWAKLLREEFEKNGDDFTDTGVDELCTLTDDELNERFAEGYGVFGGKPFVAWGKNFVYFSVTYDGSRSVGSVPRNPTEGFTAHWHGGGGGDDD